MLKGTIKRLITDRGYGFIQRAEQEDIFFHASGLQGVAFDSLIKGQHVEFDIKPTSRGLKAINIRLIKG